MFRRLAHSANTAVQDLSRNLTQSSSWRDLHSSYTRPVFTLSDYIKMTAPKLSELHRTSWSTFLSYDLRKPANASASQPRGHTPVHPPWRRPCRGLSDGSCDSLKVNLRLFLCTQHTVQSVSRTSAMWRRVLIQNWLLTHSSRKDLLPWRWKQRGVYVPAVVTLSNEPLIAHVFYYLRSTMEAAVAQSA